MLSEPLRLRKAGFEIEMFSGERTAEFTGNENRVADFSACARNYPSTRNGADDGDGDEDGIGRARRFATGNRDVVFLGELVQSLVKSQNVVGVESFAQSDRYQTRDWLPRGSSVITQRARQCFMTDFFRWVGLREMNIRDHRISLREEEFML